MYYFRSMIKTNYAIHFVLVLLLFISSCINVSGIYQSHYPSKLKHGKQIKLVEPRIQIQSTTNLLEVQLVAQSFLQNGNHIDDRTEQGSNTDQPTISVDDCIQNSNNYAPKVETISTKKISNSNNTCPKVTDLKCDYIAKNTYKLTWTKPKGELYSENGTLSEYRIIRESLSSSKIYIFKTPEPICEDSICSIVFNAQNDPKGFKWIVETRCSRTSFERGNTSQCNSNPEISDQPVATNYSGIRTTNKNSKKAILMIPILLVSGIITLIVLLQGAPFIAGMMLLAIAIGCVFSITKAKNGIQEINNSKGTQRGRGLAVLAILGATFGLLLTGLLMWVVLIY